MTSIPEIPEIGKSFINGLYYYDKEWLKLTSSDEYIKEIKKCIAYCKPDMYFNHLYRFIIKYDFEELGNQIPTKIELEKKYLEAALKILKERCSIMLSEDEIDYSLQWRIPHINYSKYLEGYKESIFNYINYKPGIYPILGLKESDNPYFSEKSSFFFQNVILTSFLIAYNRIHSEIENIEFFGAEIIPFDYKNILNIYLTPNGMLNLRLIQSWDKDETLLRFNSFINSIGIQRIYDKEQLATLMTSVILEKDGIFFYHFKPPLYDYANNFIMEKLHRPHLSSIKLETQASYQQE